MLLNKDGKNGVYYDEKGRPMQASALVRDPQFRARVVAETRALLAENFQSNEYHWITAEPSESA